MLSLLGKEMSVMKIVLLMRFRSIHQHWKQLTERWCRKKLNDVTHARTTSAGVEDARSSETLIVKTTTVAAALDGLAGSVIKLLLAARSSSLNIMWRVVVDLANPSKMLSAAALAAVTVASPERPSSERFDSSVMMALDIPNRLKSSGSVVAPEDVTEINQ